MTTNLSSVLSEPKRSWQQAPEPDLQSLIAAGVEQRRHGKHAQVKASRHSAPREVRGRRTLHPGFRFALLIGATIALVLILRSFVVASFYIPSESMEPTLHGCSTCEPDRVLVDKLTYKFTSIGRKDIVVFTKPDNLAVNDKDLIKRVIGLPGDTVSGTGGAVYVNGEKLSEPYVMASCHGTVDFAAVRVPAGQYFVMGDNRCNSTDSRVFGTIDRSSIVGRAFAVVWPLKRLSWL
jgi:signal peptidase I